MRQEPSQLSCRVSVSRVSPGSLPSSLQSSSSLDTATIAEEDLEIFEFQERFNGTREILSLIDVSKVH